jgi:serine/threonine-protein kinase
VQGIPKGLDAVLLKALAKNRDERFATAGDMQLAIEDVLFTQQLHGTTSHLAAFMREIYAEELEEEFSSEPTIIAYDLRTPTRKPQPPPAMLDDLPPTTLVPAHKPLAEMPTKPSGVLPKAPRVIPPPKAGGVATSKDATPRKSSRSGKGEK